MLLTADSVGVQRYTKMNMEDSTQDWMRPSLMIWLLFQIILQPEKS